MRTMHRFTTCREARHKRLEWLSLLRPWANIWTEGEELFITWAEDVPEEIARAANTQLFLTRPQAAADMLYAAVPTPADVADTERPRG